jgi:DNA-binding IclR family transcriptional regulator
MLLVRLHGYDVFEVARTLVHDLARETGLMCFLTTWGTYGPVVTDIDRGLVTRHTDVYLGRNLPLSSSGTGRLFQANARPGAVAQALAAESAVHPELQDKAPKPEELAEILADIRAAGYATFELGPPIGLRSLVAPVYNHMGEMWFAVTLTGEAERVHAQEAHFLARLLSGVRAISADLGYSAPR